MADVRLDTYLKELQQELDAGHYDKVISGCRHVLKSYPKNHTVYRILGQAFIGTSSWSEAGNIFNRLVGVIPNDFALHLSLGQVYDSLGMIGHAIWHLERAHHQDIENETINEKLRALYPNSQPTEYDPHALTPETIAWKHYLAERYIETADTIDSYLTEQEEERPELELLRTQALWKASRPVDATNSALSVIRKFPYCFHANAILAEVFLSEDRASSAKRYLKRIEELDPYRALEMQGKLDASDTITLPEMKQDIAHSSKNNIKGLSNLLPDHSDIFASLIPYWSSQGDNDLLIAAQAEIDEWREPVADDIENDDEFIPPNLDNVDVDSLKVAFGTNRKLGIELGVANVDDETGVIAEKDDLDDRIEEPALAETIETVPISNTFIQQNEMIDMNDKNEHPDVVGSDVPATEDTNSLLDFEPELDLEYIEDDEFVDFSEQFSTGGLAIGKDMESVASELQEPTKDEADPAPLEEPPLHVADTQEISKLETLEVARASNAEADETVEDIIEKLEEEIAPAPASNAPDWLNAMVPGLDVDYEAEEDEPVDQGYVDVVSHRSHAYSDGSSSDAGFEWLTDIVEEESDYIQTIPDPRFTFNELPRWVQDMEAEVEQEDDAIAALEADNIVDEIVEDDPTTIKAVVEVEVTEDIVDAPSEDSNVNDDFLSWLDDDDFEFGRDSQPDDEFSEFEDNDPKHEA